MSCSQVVNSDAVWNGITCCYIVARTTDNIDVFSTAHDDCKYYKYHYLTKLLYISSLRYYCENHLSTGRLPTVPPSPRMSLVHHCCGDFQNYSHDTGSGDSITATTTEYTECWPCPLFDILFNKYFPAD
jgi:hypothetical protein